MKYDVTVPVGLGEWGAPKRREEIPEEERDTGRRDEVVDALFTLDPANSMSSSEDEEDDEEEDGAHSMIGNAAWTSREERKRRARKRGITFTGTTMMRTTPTTTLTLILPLRPPRTATKTWKDNCRIAESRDS